MVVLESIISTGDQSLYRANVGDYTIKLSLLVGKGGKVY